MLIKGLAQQLPRSPRPDPPGFASAPHRPNRKGASGGDHSAFTCRSIRTPVLGLRPRDGHLCRGLAHGVYAGRFKPRRTCLPCRSTLEGHIEGLLCGVPSLFGA